MNRKIFIAPSILSADFSKLGEEVVGIEKCGADMIHCDVMDGVFVKNITFGSKMIADIKKHTKLALDTHLMIVEPERYVDNFIEAGSDYVTIHVEACKNIKKTLEHIKSCNVKCGVVIRPDTAVEKVFEYAHLCDMILVMSVYPGFSGQSFIIDSVDKIAALRKFLDANSLGTLLEVDGGINFQTAKSAISAGADVLVAGNAIFSSGDIAAAIKRLRG